MSRIVKNADKWHAITIANGRDGELLLVKGGRRAYLWAGMPGYPCVTVSGPSVLRKLAKAILAEVGKE